MPIRDILFQELDHLLDEKQIVLIDMRSRQDFEECGAYPNAINIPTLREIIQALNMSNHEFRQKYCVPKPACHCPIAFADDAKGRNAQKAAKRASALGYTNVRVYRDGFGGWLEDGGKGGKHHCICAN